MCFNLHFFIFEIFIEFRIYFMSLYGSEDGVLNREKYGECRKNLPADTQENVIEGGCHAYFGMYGEQEGDGKALIAPKEQIEETARLAAEWIKKGKTG